MPPRRRSQPASPSLTADDLARLTAAVAEGRRATVYLREAVPGLGLESGSSARVLSVSGATVTVKPRGVDDELPYEADELRVTKNAPPKSAPKKPAAPKKSPVRKNPAPVATRTSAPEPAKAVPSVDQRSEVTPALSTAPRNPAVKRTATKTAKSVSVTVYGSADNEWFVAMTRGTTKPPRARAVTPEAVDAAMRELGDTVAHDAVTSVMSVAREEAKRRVDELSRELESARQALAALDSTD